MTAGGYEVEGLDRLIRTLDAAKDDLDNLEDAHASAAATAARAAAALAPRRTGTLAASLTGTARPGEATVTASAPYAGFVHWGTRHVAARPFALEATQRNQARLLPIYTASVRDALRKVKGT